MRQIAEHKFPARNHRAAGAVVLRQRNVEESHPYVTHWRNDQAGGHTGGGYDATLAEGIARFDASVAEEMAAQAAVNPPPAGPFSWELWCSHKSEGNDDCLTGDTCETFGEAVAQMRKWSADFRSESWAYACIMDASGATLQEETNPSHDPSREDDLSAERSEAAGMAGMAHGVKGRNEAMGEEIEEPSGFGFR